jgi:hypothetical protein
MKKLLIASLVLVSTYGFADDATDAYCKYVAEQAMAQRDILRTPNAVVGPIQPSTGTSPQMVFGLTNSLSNDRKAGLTMQAAKTQCALYIVAADAQQRIFFALPSLEKDVLRHRLALIDRASNQLDALIAQNMKLVEAQNLTKPAVYSLQAAKMRLDTTRTEALTGIASPYVPKLSTTPLRELVGEKLLAETNNQRAVNKLNKQNSWDVQIDVGGHKQLSQATTGSMGAYGGFNLTYNLGRTAADRHLDNSVAAYDQWKATQFDDVAQQASILKQQMVETVKIQEGQLQVLQAHDADISVQLQSLEGVDTAAALSFKNQLLADQIVLAVDVDDIKFRISELQQYIADNF